MKSVEDAFGFSPTNSVTIVLNGDPVAKGRPRFSRKSGATYTPVKTQRYEDRLAWAAQVVMRGLPLFDVALTVQIVVYKSVPDSWSIKKRTAAIAGATRPIGKPDVDNYAKCMDALNKIVWADDAQIVALHVFKHYSDRPRIEISITPLSVLTAP